MNGLCQAAGVSRAGYYRFLRRPQRKEANMDLRSRIQGIALHWPAYGYRRVQVELRKQGWEVNSPALISEENGALRIGGAIITTADLNSP